MAATGVAFQTQQDTPGPSNEASQVCQRIVVFRYLAPVLIEKIGCRGAPPKRVSRLALASELGKVNVGYPHARERGLKLR